MEAVALYGGVRDGVIRYYTDVGGRFWMERLPSDSDINGVRTGKWILLALSTGDSGEHILGIDAYRNKLADQHGFVIDREREWHGGELVIRTAEYPVGA